MMLSRLVIVSFVALGFFGQSWAWASGISGGKVARTIASASLGYYIVQFDGVINSTDFGALPSCATHQTGSEKKYLLRASFPGAKLILSEINLARILGKPITVQGAGNCDPINPTIEVLEFTNLAN